MAQLEDINDILINYVEDYMPGVWVDANRDFNNYFVVQELFKKRMERGGDSPSTTFRFKTDEADNTIATELFDTDSLNRVELFEKATVYYALQKTHFEIDVRESGVQGSDPKQILNHLDGLASDMMDGFAQRNEEWFFTLPTAPNSTNRKPLGLPYWVVKSTATTEEDFAFNGSNPSGYSDVAGLDRSTAAHSKLKNGTGVYVSLSATDGLKKLRTAVRKSNFRPPYDNKGEFRPDNRYMLISHDAPWETYQDLLFASNDNVGTDMGKYNPRSADASLYFRGIPWMWCSALSESTSSGYDADQPIYGLDMSSWKVRQRGDWFMKKKMVEMTNPHNVRVTWMDTILQYLCFSPRSNFVLHKSGNNS